MPSCTVLTVSALHFSLSLRFRLSVSNVTSSRPAEAFKYFIGGLPPDCRTETLESHMNSYGAVKVCLVPLVCASHSFFQAAY